MRASGRVGARVALRAKVAVDATAKRVRVGGGCACGHHRDESGTMLVVVHRLGAQLDARGVVGHVAVLRRRDEQHVPKMAQRVRLGDQRKRNRRHRRQPTRAIEAVSGHPVAWPLPLGVSSRPKPPGAP